MQTPELQQRISEWRRKTLDGTITPEEWAQAIIVLREHRQTAMPTTSRATPSADAMLDELAGL